MMEEIILAVDGGATKTALTLRKRDGTILLDKLGESSNYQTSGADQVLAVLVHLLTEVKSAFPSVQVDIAVFALAGIDSERDRTVVQSIVEEACLVAGLQVAKLIVENDAQAAMLGATGCQPGVLLISGTGSIAFAHDGKGDINRSGGWGHRAGDEGSGYWIGREALRAIFRMEDGRGAVTSLYRSVLEELSIETSEELADWLYGSAYSVDRVARLSIVVDRCAQQGDRVSIRILEQASEELALLVASVIRKSNLEETECVVYLNGGAVMHSGRIRGKLEEIGETEFPQCRFVMASRSPLEYIVERGWQWSRNEG